MVTKINLGKSLLVFMVLLMMPMLAYAGDISACGTLGDENTTYTLTQNVSVTDNDCFQLRANNVTLDCQGYTISFTNGNAVSSYEIPIIGYNDTTIKNCNMISNSGSNPIGIYLSNSYNGTLQDNNISTGTTSIGIYLVNVNNYTLNGNIIKSTGTSAIAFEPQGLYNSTIYNNKFSASGTSSRAMTSHPVSDSLAYNNFFNGTVYFAGSMPISNWNTTNQTGTRIYEDGTNIGGNYYTDETGTGNSDTCTDADYDGFCDSSFTLDTNNTDYLPLSDEYGNAPLECGSLGSADTVYTLTQNVESNGTCFTIEANNVTLDCNGYTINYSQTESGHGVADTSGSYDYPTIKNCNIVQGSASGTSYGIYTTTGVDYVSILNNNISSSNYAVYVRFRNSSITGNNIISTGSDGIRYGTIGTDDNITGNNITASGNGIYLSQDARQNIIGNVINTTGNGISFTDSANCNITGNVIDATSAGINIGGGANYANITGNIIYSDSNGISYTTSDYQTIDYNNITASVYGISLSSSATYSNYSYNNIVSTNSSIYTASTSADFNTFYNNNMTSTSASVVSIVSDGNLFYNNLFSGYFDNLSTTGNSWNTSNQTGVRIFGNGTNIGGNYYTNSTSDGYSDVCVDLDYDGFCDVAFTIGDYDIDYLALSDEYTTPTTTTTTTSTTTTSSTTTTESTTTTSSTTTTVAPTTTTTVAPSTPSDFNTQMMLLAVLFVFVGFISIGYSRMTKK